MKESFCKWPNYFLKKKLHKLSVYSTIYLKCEDILCKMLQNDSNAYLFGKVNDGYMDSSQTPSSKLLDNANTQRMFTLDPKQKRIWSDFFKF